MVLSSMSQNLMRYVLLKVLARHKTLVGKPQQNGVAECINRSLLEKARCMLSNADL